MSATEAAVISSGYIPFDSSIVKFILAMSTQRQQIVEQGEKNKAMEELIHKLEQEKNELKALLEPHKEYKALFDETIMTLKEKIENIKNIQCKPEEEEIKINGIKELKAKILECQVHFNKAGTAAYIREQEKELAQLEKQISELKQNLNEGKSKLATLQSSLTKMEQELESKKSLEKEPSPDLVSLTVQKIQTVFASFLK